LKHAVTTAGSGIYGKSPVYASPPDRNHGQYSGAYRDVSEAKRIKASEK